MEGEPVEYARARVNAECPRPGPGDKGKAAAKVSESLKKFGEEYCKAGKCPGAEQCKPRILKIEKLKYATSDQASGQGKICYVTATGTGTIACECGAA